MAYKIIKKELCLDADPLVTIIMDSESDVSDLPTTGCGAGSIAIIADEDLPIYALNASGTWTAAQ